MNSCFNSKSISTLSMTVLMKTEMFKTPFMRLITKRRNESLMMIKCLLMMMSTTRKKRKRDSTKMNSCEC